MEKRWTLFTVQICTVWTFFPHTNNLLEIHVTEVPLQTICHIMRPEPIIRWFPSTIMPCQIAYLIAVPPFLWFWPPSSLRLPCIPVDFHQHWSELHCTKHLWSLTPSHLQIWLARILITGSSTSCVSCYQLLYYLLLNGGADPICSHSSILNLRIPDRSPVSKFQLQHLDPKVSVFHLPHQIRTPLETTALECERSHIRRRKVDDFLWITL